MNIYKDVEAVPLHTDSVYTFLPTSLQKAFVEAFREVTRGIEYEMPHFTLSEEQYQQLPTLFLQFEVR